MTIMRRSRVSFFVLLLTAASVAAQSPPAAPPCPTASVLLTAQPIFGVGAKTIASACPAFLRALADWYLAHPDVSGAELARAIAGTSLPVTPPKPPTPEPPPLTLDPGTGAPEPAAASVIIFRDAFDRPASSIASGYPSRGSMTATDGRSGSAIRFPYSASSSDNVIGTVFAETRDIYIRYWYRLSPRADPSCGSQNGSGFKWFMLERAGTAPRYTMGVGLLGRGNAGLEFSTHDNSSTQMPNPFLQNKTKTARFGTTNDGQWHAYTLHVVTGPSGYEQIWIDGALVLDSSGFGYDHSAVGIATISFPGNMVSWPSGCSPFTVDVDDLVVWRN